MSENSRTGSMYFLLLQARQTINRDDEKNGGKERSETRATRGCCARAALVICGEIVSARFTGFLRWKSLAGFKREQIQTEATNLRQDAMERRLVLYRTPKKRGTLLLLHDLQSPEPVLPGRVEESF